LCELDTEISDPLAIVLHLRPEVDMPHRLHQNLEVTNKMRQLQLHRMHSLLPPIKRLQQIPIEIHQREIMHRQIDLIAPGPQLRLIEHEPLIPHLQSLVLERHQLVTVPQRLLGQVEQQVSVCQRDEGFYLDRVETFGNVRDLPGCVLRGELAENVEFLGGGALLVDGGVVVVGGDVAAVVEGFVLETVGTRPETKVAATVRHVHRERVIVRHEETELTGIVDDRLPLPLLPPMRQPPTIDLTTNQVPLGFHGPCLLPILLLNPVIDPHIGALPVTLLDILDPVDIVLSDWREFDLLP